VFLNEQESFFIYENLSRFVSLFLLSIELFLLKNSQCSFFNELEVEFACASIENFPCVSVIKKEKKLQFLLLLLLCLSSVILLNIVIIVVIVVLSTS
jgi:hypothetical protein